MERVGYKPFKLYEYMVSGNLGLLESAVKNKNTIYFMDSDGFNINSPYEVCNDFTNKTEGKVKADDKLIDEWYYLGNLARANDLPWELITHAEDGWYDPDVIGKARRYLFMKPLVRLLVKHAGPEKVFVITARQDNLHDATKRSYKAEFPEIKQENIIFSASKTETMLGIMEGFGPEAQPILMEDSFKNLEDAHAKIPNSLGIFVPLGLVQAKFFDPRILQFKRYPIDPWQGMQPVYEAFKHCVAQC